MQINVNITAALNTDAAAPVSNENNQRQTNTRKAWMIFDFLIKGILANTQMSTRYMSARCIPDIAMICTTPVLL